MLNVKIVPCTEVDQVNLLPLRQVLWPHCSPDAHLVEMTMLAGESERSFQRVAYIDPMLPVGFVEASMRFDYVNGTESSPVAFLEGIFVAPEYRCQGIAPRLITAVVEWATLHGCQELASDALFENEISLSMHEALGFRETERVVFFSKRLR
ncbi:MAG: GNAT family N-acetyltransferase [Methylococcaceae bacterium]|nr:GNAT family N-acetyltransferase [Methylococcaceae bacterium]